MGWNNPPLSWQEFERTLSRRPASRTPDSAEDPAEPGTPAGPALPALPALPPSALASTAVPYAELHAHSSFSFLDGATNPRGLVAEATRLGLTGLAITDHNGLYGAANFAEEAQLAARAAGVSPLLTVYGAELSLGLSAPQLGVADPEGTHLLVLARGAAGYHRLAAAITEGQLAGGEKGRPLYDLDQLADTAAGDWVILTGCSKGAVRQALASGSGNRSDREAHAARELQTLTDLFGADNVYVELTHHGHPGDDATNLALASLAAQYGRAGHGLPTIATGGVHYATGAEAPLADALAAVRARRSLTEMDPYLAATGAARLRSGAAMARRFTRFPGAVARTVPLARELAFSLRAATPKLPKLEVPEGHTQMSWLRRLTWEGAERRYGSISPSTRERLERELEVIEAKDFPGYFLIVHDIVQFAKGRGILCQGRGSAANSAVCYVLGITAVDSILYNLPFERFLSSMRDEEPDIDVDFDSGRREEAIQYVYRRYGRRNAAQVANVISYRPKAAIRDAAKALGYSAGQQLAWARQVERRGAIESGQIPPQVQDLATQMLKLPRHLGIHSGGMVLTERPVGEVCPIEHARMEGRTVLQWDKESCAWMGLVKFDLLGLGMLSALQQAMDLVAEHTGVRWEMSTIPKEEPGVYDMLCRADAIGVFQVESRAQLNTLPRLKPRSFYDLVIEIALIRPGPIQGGAIHPYLRRRGGEEPVTYPHPALEPVLERTLGVPLFQEQLMQMAMAVGGCSAEDADLLRRSMGSKRGEEHVVTLREKLFAGMRANGLTQEDAQRIYDQIEAFASFGFAESHSISFALLVYVSAWFKLHYPAAFLASLLNAQPMGFYAPRTLVEDARRHGVEVLQADVQRSGIDAGLEALGATGESHSRACSGSRAHTAPDCTAAPGADPGANSNSATDPGPVPPFDPAAPDTSGAHRLDRRFAVRLGLTGVRGIDPTAAERIVSARKLGPFAGLPDLARRANLDRTQLEALAAAGALAGLGLDRRAALWAAAPAADHREEFLAGSALEVQPPLLPVLSPAEQSALDLWATGITTGVHPMSHLRGGLDGRGIVRSDGLPRARPGQRITVAGIVTHRQRPATASGVTFISLEDETGTVNIVVWAKVWERNRFVARSSPALVVHGVYERSPEGVGNVIAETFEPLSSPHGVRSRDFQ